MIRRIYSLVWHCVLPLVLLRLWWRGRVEPGYRRHVKERFGWYPVSPLPKRPIWVHAVSVGETRAAEPLIAALMAQYPDCGILLTHMTPTGRATGSELFARHSSRLMQCYLPYDIGWMMARFIRHFAPRICILMETEVWPNLVSECTRRQLPVALVNARLSERSLSKAQRFTRLFSPAAQGLAFAAAQTASDAHRLRMLGVERVEVTGNIKFDMAPSPELLIRGTALRAQIGSRPVLLCASTREGEEALILDALLKDDLGDALLMMVPRHPQRFDEVARMVSLRNLMLCRRSQLGTEWVGPEVKVLLGDSMGEMAAYYAACDIAFIGGSLLPLGGQNLIEACAIGKPVLLGPHTFNFLDASQNAIACGAALRVQTAAEMIDAAKSLLRNDMQRVLMGAKARAFAEEHRGATRRTLALLQRQLA